MKTIADDIISNVDRWERCRLLSAYLLSFAEAMNTVRPGEGGGQADTRSLAATLDDDERASLGVVVDDGDIRFRLAGSEDDYHLYLCFWYDEVACYWCSHAQCDPYPDLLHAFDDEDLKSIPHAVHLLAEKIVAWSPVAFGDLPTRWDELYRKSLEKAEAEKNEGATPNGD